MLSDFSTHPTFQSINPTSIGPTATSIRLPSDPLSIANLVNDEERENRKSQHKRFILFILIIAAFLIQFK